MEDEVLSGTHQGNIFALESSSSGSKIVYDVNPADTPAQFFAADVDGGSKTVEEQITDLNNEILPRISVPGPAGSWRCWCGCLEGGKKPKFLRAIGASHTGPCPFMSPPDRSSLLL